MKDEEKVENVSTDADNKENGEKTVFVCLATDPTVSEEEVKALLDEAGVDCEIEIIEDPSDAEFGEDDVLVLILEDGDGDPDQAECARLAVQAGVCQIIGVWSPSATEEGIPLGTVRYGTDQVPWEPAKVGAAIAGGGNCDFETPTGKKASSLTTPTNKCGG